MVMAPTIEKAFAAEEEEMAEREVEPMPPLAEEASVLSDMAEEVRIEGDSRARLRATVTRYATNHPARLREALATVPQSARPALRRAIAISETGYEKILESLD